MFKISRTPFVLQQAEELVGLPVVGVGQIAGADDDVPVVALEVPWQTATEQSTELSMLSWHSRISQFDGRAEEMKKLIDWAESGDAISIKLVIGDGGVGKSRLGAEIASRLADDGWSAGFLDLREAQAFPLAEKGTLLIIDYPEEQREDVIALLEDLAKVAATYCIRVLFLTRRKKEEWSKELAVAEDGNIHVDEAVEIEGIDAAAAHVLYNTALERAAEFFKSSPPPLSVEALAEWMKLEDENNIALFIVALAIHSALYPDQEAVHYRGREVVLALAERELNRIKDLAEAQGFPNGNTLNCLLAMAAIAKELSVATVEALAAKNDLELALPPNRLTRDVLRNTGVLVAPPEGLGVRTQLARDGIVVQGTIPAPKPDIVAAAMLVKAFSADAELAPERVWAALELDVPGGMQRIARLCYDAEQTLGVLDQHQRLTEWLAISIEDRVGRCQQLESIFFERPLYGWSKAAVNCLETIADNAVDDEDRVVVLNNLSIQLFYSGADRRSFEVIAQVVELYRRLAAAEPTRYVPKLATALNNLAISSGAIGDVSGALEAIKEAVTIRRDLVVGAPSLFEPDLASSLNNLASSLRAFGDMRGAHAAATEAVLIYRRLASTEPTRFESNLAGSLSNLAGFASEVGDTLGALEASKESVLVSRRLAVAEPLRFEPDLATCLSNLAIVLNDFGDQEGALVAIREAESIHRRLAAAEPARFEPYLAASLGGLSNRLNGVDDRRNALAAIEEAVMIRRRLAAAEPARFEIELAKSQITLANRLLAVGDARRAQEEAEMAVTIIRRWAAKEPVRHEPDLALSLNSLSLILHYMGDVLGAEKAIDETVTIYRRFSQAEPARFEPDLARSLGLTGAILVSAGDPCAAVACFDEAAALIAPHAERLPGSPIAKLHAGILEDKARAEAACRENPHP